MTTKPFGELIWIDPSGVAPGANTWAKCGGSTTPGTVNKFSQAAHNRLQYDGDEPGWFEIQARVNHSTSSLGTVDTAIAKKPGTSFNLYSGFTRWVQGGFGGGTPYVPGIFRRFAYLYPGDWIEAWFRPGSAITVTTGYGTLSATPLPDSFDPPSSTEPTPGPLSDIADPYQTFPDLTIFGYPLHLTGKLPARFAHIKVRSPTASEGAYGVALYKVLLSTNFQSKSAPKQRGVELRKVGVYNPVAHASETPAGYVLELDRDITLNPLEGIYFVCWMGGGDNAGWFCPEKSEQIVSRQFAPVGAASPTSYSDFPVRLSEVRRSIPTIPVPSIAVRSARGEKLWGNPYA